MLNMGMVMKNKITHDKFKIGADITWIMITGLKQIIMINELYALGHAGHY